jgi:pimeloyl-ACP methyl ester carboxylesterase
MVGAMNAIAVIREGDGPKVLLVHGGASPGTTWGALASLRARWTLAFVHRRRYPPSPARADGRQNFEVGASSVSAIRTDHLT